MRIVKHAVRTIPGEEEKMRIVYVHEPTDLQCGQAVLAMLTHKSAETVCAELGNERETDLREMKEYLKAHGFLVSGQRRQAEDRNGLPELCLLSLETPRCWHWSLYAEGTFYDPEHGMSGDFPECARKYYWKIVPSAPDDAE